MGGNWKKWKQWETKVRHGKKKGDKEKQEDHKTKPLETVGEKEEKMETENKGEQEEARENEGKLEEEDKGERGGEGGREKEGQGLLCRSQPHMVNHWLQKREPISTRNLKCER